MLTSSYSVFTWVIVFLGVTPFFVVFCDCCVCAESRLQYVRLVSRQLLSTAVWILSKCPLVQINWSKAICCLCLATKVRHTFRNLHFLSKNSTMISREKLSIFFGWKTRENVVVLDFLAVDNFDFTRKIVKKNLGEKLVKL